MSSAEPIPNGGLMGARVRSYDWATTPLGALETWPPSLRTALSIMLSSAFPTFLAWGPALTSFYNDAYLPMMADKPEGLGAPFPEVWAEAWDVVGPITARAMKGEASYFEDLPLTLLRKGYPEETWFSFSYSPVCDEEGKVRGVLCTVHETTQRVRNEVALRETQARLQAAIDLAGLSPYTWDPGTGALEWDARLKAMWGLAPNAAVNHDVWLAGIHPEDRPRVEAAVAQCRNPSGDGIYHVEYRVIGIDDGVERWVASRGRTTFENGEPVGFIGAALEVTERKRIEQRLREDEARQTFLLALGDRLHRLSDPRQAMSLAAEMLGQHLQADRVGYSEVAPGEMLSVNNVWSRAGMASVTGQRRLQDLGAALAEDLRAGRMTRYDDALAEGRTPGDELEAIYKADRGRAVINIPLVKDGVLAAVLYVHHAGPRHWKDAEVELIREVADRIWASIQRARAEAALRQSEERFRQLTNLIPTFVWYVDPVGAVTFANEQWYTYTGITDEPPERWPELVFHPSERSASRAAWLHHLEAGVAFDIEARIRRHDGPYRWFVTRTVPVRDAEGRITGWFSAATDIHDRKLAEERFREFAVHSTNVLWVANTRNRALEYLSPAFETVFGAPRNHFLQDRSPLVEVVHPDDRPRALNAFDRAASGEVAVEEFRVIRRDGAVRWIRNTFFPIRDEQGTIQRLGGIAEDITRHEGRFVYVVDGDKTSQKSLSRLLREAGYDVRFFPSSKAFLGAAPALAAGCVVLDLHQPGGLAVPRELKARRIGLPVIALGEPQGDVMFGVQVMKAGAIDFLAVPYEPAQLLTAIASAAAGTRGAEEHNKDADRARTQIAELSRREREVLNGLLAGKTNKEMGRALGISPRTVEAHRAHLMQHLGVKTVPGVVRVAALADLHAD
jgi:PAS domain S-box-containing protein